jgi:hypothetical protein
VSGINGTEELGYKDPWACGCCVVCGANPGPSLTARETPAGEGAIEMFAIVLCVVVPRGVVTVMAFGS